MPDFSTRELYSGPLTLSHGGTSAEVRTTLYESQEFYAEPDAEGYVRSVAGLRSWGGVARVPGLVYRLLDLLGSECEVILPDGRTGTALVTGYSEESVWVVEIVGAGPPPE